MAELRVRNVQEAYVRGLELLRQGGRWEETRNGRALVYPEPVMTVYDRPTERVLLDPRRDANPFFHLMEGFWMLAGRQDVESIGRFSSGIKPFSDDGVTFHGAYGHRWRRHFQEGDFGETPMDQLARCIELLRHNPQDRRVVMTMWDPEADLACQGLDFPCNTQVYFRVRTELEVVGASYSSGLNGAHQEDVSYLDMTVTCRSNDAIWGAYGANAVHFGTVLEFVAAAVGCRVGRLIQLSNNLHAYEKVLEGVGEPVLPYRRETATHYEGGVDQLQAMPLFQPQPDHPAADLLAEADDIWRFVEDQMTSAPTTPVRGPPEGILTRDGIQTIHCVVASWYNYKHRDRKGALWFANQIPAPDWRRACTEWLERRYEK